MRKHSNIKRNKNYRNGDYPKPISSRRDNSPGLSPESGLTSSLCNGSKKSKYLLAGLTTFSLAFIVAYIASAEFMGIGNSDASTNVSAAISSGSYFINVTSLGEVNIAVDAIEGGGIGTGNDIVTVNTNTKGYKLYLSTDNSNTNGNRMYLGGDSSSTYYLSPTGNTNGALTANSWGFSINNGSTYSPVPLKGNESLIVNKWNSLTPGTNTTNTHTITYGAKADLAVPAGNYRSTVLYSVIAEANSATGIASISPTSINYASSDTQTLTVTVPMFTNMDYGTWTVKVGSSTCSNPSTSKVDNKLNITCNIARNLTPGTYTVTATSSKYGTYTATNALIYKETRTLFDITNMQDMSSDICDNTKTPSASATLFDTNGTHKSSDSYVPQWTLTDTRTGNKKYVVQKMPDGKCWMVQNLAIDPGTLPASKTNVSSDYVLPSTTSFSSNTAADVKTGSHTDGSLTSTGNWYSFVAATAGTGSSVTNDGEQASADICPKNWRLPNGGPSGEFQTLYNTYGSYNSETIAKFNAHFHPVATGLYRDGSLLSSGSSAYYMSRTSKSSTQSYKLAYDWGISFPDPSSSLYSRTEGISVRCVALQ